MNDLFKMNVLRQDGSDSGKQIDLSKLDKFVDVNEHVVYLAVKSWLANQRQGTHKSKERSEISGSTRKLFKQKGTGGARRGDIKSPLLRGGGRIFGPKPSEYTNKINKKEKRLALLSVLTSRFQEQAVRVIEGFKMESYKTKDFLKMFGALSEVDKKTLIIISEENNNLLLASRNINTVLVRRYSDVSVYDIVNYPNLLIDESSVNMLIKSL